MASLTIRLPRTRLEWAVEIVCAGLLLSAIIPTVLLSIPAILTSTNGDNVGLLIFAVVLSYFMIFWFFALFMNLDVLQPVKVGFVPAQASPTTERVFALDAMQQALYLSYKRWFKLALLLGTIPPIWSLLERSVNHTISPLIWIWPLWAVVLIGSRIIYRRKSLVLSYLPPFRIDWLVEFITTILTLSLAVAITYAWWQRLSIKDYMTSFESFLMIFVPMVISSVCFPSMHQILLTFFTSHLWRTGTEREVLWRYRLLRSRNGWAFLAWVTVLTLAVIKWYVPHLIPTSGSQAPERLLSYLNHYLPQIVFVILFVATQVIYDIIGKRVPPLSNIVSSQNELMLDDVEPMSPPPP